MYVFLLDPISVKTAEPNCSSGTSEMVFEIRLQIYKLVQNILLNFSIRKVETFSILYCLVMGEDKFSIDMKQKSCSTQDNLYETEELLKTISMKQKSCSRQSL